MNRLRIAGNGNYQAMGDLQVTNLFSHTATKHFAWLSALGRCVNQSIIAFDYDLNVIYMNNAWGTFENTRRVKTIDDILDRAEDIYINPQILEDAIKETARFMECRNFCLHMLHTGLDIICRCQPVIDQGILEGIVLAAWKQDSTTLPRGEISTLRIVE